VSARPLLEVTGLGRDFGGLAAVGAVDFSVAEGSIKALIGPNGAGKTTILSMVAGALAPSRGCIVFDGRPLPGRAHAVAARGIARTFQLGRPFGEMTVLETALVGCHRLGRAGWLASALRTRAQRREEARLRERALAILASVGLQTRADAVAGALPYGEQRLMEVARALATHPRLLLLDEPGAGLDAEEHRRLGALVRGIRDGGTTVLLVDHHMEFVLDVADEVLVLCHGERLAEGPPAVIRRDPAVVAAYLGAEAA
jgi:ABC-type branched-subunit amino acid transport system ATPase component